MDKSSLWKQNTPQVGRISNGISGMEIAAWANWSSLWPLSHCFFSNGDSANLKNDNFHYRGLTIANQSSEPHWKFSGEEQKRGFHLEFHNPKVSSRSVGNTPSNWNLSCYLALISHKITNSLRARCFSPSTIIFSVLWSPVWRTGHISKENPSAAGFENFCNVVRSADVSLQMSMFAVEVAKIINPKLCWNVATCSRGKRLRPASLGLRSKLPMKRCPLF